MAQAVVSDVKRCGHLVTVISTVCFMAAHTKTSITRSNHDGFTNGLVYYKSYQRDCDFECYFLFLLKKSCNVSTHADASDDYNKENRLKIG